MGAADRAATRPRHRLWTPTQFGEPADAPPSLSRPSPAQTVKAASRLPVRATASRPSTPPKKCETRALPDTAQKVRAILSRTLRELDEAIENPSVSSVLSDLGSLLGVDGGDSTAARAAQASRTSTSGASRRSESARGGPSASGARKSAPTPTRGRPARPRLTARSPARQQKAQVGYPLPSPWVCPIRPQSQCFRAIRPISASASRARDRGFETRRAHRQKPC